MDFRQQIELKLYYAGLTYEADASGINVWPKHSFSIKTFETCSNHLKRSCFEFQKNVKEIGVGRR